jgi:hypothetical protein
MKRSRSILWGLLLLQVLPALVVILDQFGVFDPLGLLLENTVPPPVEGESPSIAIHISRFVVSYWFIGCIIFTMVGSLVAAVYVSFDRSQTKLQRTAWIVSFVLAQSVTVILYCVLSLLGSASPQPNYSSKPTADAAA